MEELVTLKQIVEAAEKLRQVISPSPIKYSTTFSRMTGSEVYLKAENLQKTGSFKIRGAYNKIYSLTSQEKKRGIIAVSAGNHAQGAALAASLLGVKSLVVMPKTAPLSKITATEDYGARVILTGENYIEVQEAALQIAEKENLVLIHPFNDPLVIAGQGTIGLEILKERQDLDAVIVPVGGGGLISGISTVLKKLRPEVQVIGVQAASCPAVFNSFLEGKILSVKRRPTMADGIAVEKPGSITFEILKKYVDTMAAVEEEDIAQTILMLLERTKLMVEGAGAVGLTALLSRKINLVNKKVVVVLSGGNIDVTLLSRIINRGLARSGRLIKLNVLLPDKAGVLSELLGIVSDREANVLDIRHERLSLELPIDFVEVELLLETRDREHSEEIIRALVHKKYKLKPTLSNLC